MAACTLCKSATLHGDGALGSLSICSAMLRGDMRSAHEPASPTPHSMLMEFEVDL